MLQEEHQVDLVTSRGGVLDKLQGKEVSGGLFGQDRYGLDVKWMWPVTSWLAIDAQLGFTGYWSMAVDWDMSDMDCVTGWIDTRAYLEKYDTEFRVRGWRYVYEDYGVTGECMRHFKHCTVGVYAQYSNIGKENGGFKVIMMLPPYAKKTRKVNVRPASNFRLLYDIQADPWSNRTYNTDPEENKRGNGGRLSPSAPTIPWEPMVTVERRVKKNRQTRVTARVSTSVTTMWQRRNTWH